MNVILLERIRNLGDLGAQVSVKAGFARNYLIPNGKAVMATKDNLVQFETRRKELEKIAEAKLNEAKERATQLDVLSLTLEANASEEGKLYGSIGTHEIHKAVVDAGYAVEKREVQLPLGAIHDLGEYEVHVRVHTDVTATVRVNVIAAK